MMSGSTRGEYGSRIPEASRGGIIESVEPGSPAAREFLEPGDLILAAEGRRLRDVIDWHWLADGDSVSIQVAKPGNVTEEFVLHRQPGEPWGISFSETVFDGIRTCRNRCAFCFMTQLPKGLRRALYLRDDDFRLSFLQGNFISLTNLSSEDVARIAEQHLSPLYVSLHAVDRAVRAQLVCAKEDRALKRFDQLAEAGIDLHVQIVLVPGVNDGAVLEESLTWLAEREGVASVGIVPLGYTGHQTRFDGSYEVPTASAAVIEQVAVWQQACRERDGVDWVYLADEFYLNARIEVPAAFHYDGYPQYENGIGLVRSYLDDALESSALLAEAISHIPEHRAVILMTGELFAPVLSAVLAPLDPEARIRVVAVPNRFFGGNVGVTGLLTGADLLPALAETPEDAVILVPDVVVNADGLLLDDRPVESLAQDSSRDVRLLSCDVGGLLGGLRGVASNPPPSEE